MNELIKVSTHSIVWLHLSSMERTSIGGENRILSLLLHDTRSQTPLHSVPTANTRYSINICWVIENQPGELFDKLARGPVGCDKFSRCPEKSLCHFVKAGLLRLFLCNQSCLILWAWRLYLKLALILFFLGSAFCPQAPKSFSLALVSTDSPMCTKWNVVYKILEEPVTLWILRTLYI